MPFLAPIAAFIVENIATIGAVASIAGTGFTVGETLAHEPGSPNPAAQQLQQQQQQQVQQNLTTQQQEKAAIARQFPNLQEQLGGSVAPDYLIHQASIEAGAPGETNVGEDAFRQFLGDRSLTSATNLNLSPTAPNAPQGGAFWDTIQPGGQVAPDSVSGASL